MKYVANISEKGIHIYFKSKPLKGARVRIEDLNISRPNNEDKREVQYVFIVLKSPLDERYSIDAVYRAEIGKVIQDQIMKGKIKLLPKEDPYIAVRLQNNEN